MPCRLWCEKKKQNPSHPAQLCQPAGHGNSDIVAQFCPSRIELRARVAFEKILAMAKAGREPDSDSDFGCGSAPWSYGQFEKLLRAQVFILGRLLSELFLSSARDGLRRKQGKPPGRVRRRQFKGLFGTVTYWREGRRGHFPLDHLLGIAKGGFSHAVCLLACNLAVRVSYAGAGSVFGRFAGWSPDAGSIENMVLGVGANASSYMEESAPRRPGDKRQVLVIEIDGKAPPTATEEELEKRSAKAKARRAPGAANHQSGSGSGSGNASAKPCGCCCQRHRAKEKRLQAGKQEKVKPGESKQAGHEKAGKNGANADADVDDKEQSKSKNGRSATIVVTYVLEEGSDGLLHGPKDKRVWADFGPRVHMMQWALEEACRRGFDPQSEDIHLVMDGECCLRDGMRERFPNASMALDIRHAEEHLNAIAKLIYSKEEEKAVFVESYRAMLHEGKARQMTEDLQALVKDANKQKRRAGSDSEDGEYEPLDKEIAYFTKRLDMMDYGGLKEKDLVIASGQVEGAARHVVGDRMDCGGMRWVVERARVLLHLRCIEINGDWDKFDAWLLERTHKQLARGQIVKLTSKSPPPMPHSIDHSAETAEAA